MKILKYNALCLFTFLVSVIITSSAVVKESDKGIKTTSDSKTSFWKEGIVYQIYPRSIFDSNEDGTGDIKGITAKADYFVELGVEMIWLSPILQSPMKDFGYDISSFTAIDPIFGTMEDFDNLIREFHSRGLKVIFDFVPNHTSDQHEWFQKSVKNDSQYKDYYVWKDSLGLNDAGEPIPPNNWLSVFRFSAWEWSEERQQFYLHQFLKEQPDLNYRNPDVVSEMNNVIRFWLDKGVDGFRVDALKFLFEIENVYGADEPIATDSGVTDPTRYEYLNHTSTVNQPETFEVTRGWRQILDTYQDKVMMVEVYDDDIKEIMKYYGNETDPIADFPFNFMLITNFQERSDVTGINLKANVHRWIDNMPQGAWPNWVLGNHDNGRVASRFGADLVDALNMFILLLPGTPVTYYGEEIGMENTFISFEDTQDPSGCNQGEEHYTETSRDPERTPMQWDDTKFAGFTQGNKTWIPVNENYPLVNVKLENESQQSHLLVYKQLAQLRTENIFQLGTLDFQLATEDIVAFIRSHQTDQRYLIVINTSVDEVTVDVTTGSIELPATGSVVVRSSTDVRTETEVGSTLNLNSLSLIGGEGLVLLLQE